jgi:hypothetical protein
MNDKFILTVRELHLGNIKETFRAGAVIEHDAVNNRLIVDGRKFDDTRDLDILKRQAQKNPKSAWIIPFSQEARDEILGMQPKPQSKKPAPGEGMQVIQSDEDLTDPIDISDTQISKRKQEAKEAQQKKVKSEKMEIIRGDETVEERIAALKGKNDISSIAERARLKAVGPASMEIVKDDSSGQGVGKSQVSLNIGQVLPSPATVAEKSEEARAAAEARKKEVERNRKAAEVEEPAVGTAIEMDNNDTDADKDSQIVALKAKIAALEAKNKPAVVRSPITTAPVRKVTRKV